MPLTAGGGAAASLGGGVSGLDVGERADTDGVGGSVSMIDHLSAKAIGGGGAGAARRRCANHSAPSTCEIDARRCGDGSSIMESSSTAAGERSSALISAAKARKPPSLAIAA